MKIIIGLVLSVALIITGFYLWKTSKKNHRMAPSVSNMLWAGFSMVFFYVVALMVEVARVVLFAYCAYYISVAWLLFFLLYFSLEYTENFLEDIVRKDFMMILLGIDSLALVWNFFSQKMFGLKVEIVFGSAIIYKPDMHDLFFVHYAFMLLITVLCLIGLLHRFFTAPSFYRMKYFMIAIIFGGMVVLNIKGFGQSLDYSVLAYVAEMICIYYCAFVYTPQRLLPQTLTKVTGNMSVGILALDLEGRKIYSNRIVEEYLNPFDPLQDDMSRDLEKWCREQSRNHTDETVFEETFYKGIVPRFFKIQLQRVEDNKKQLQGCYFIIQDRTEEINELKKKQHLATHDRLTDLYIKEHFYEQTEKYIKSHPEEELYIVCTDIKDFKMINDFFGSRMGDAVLMNYADKIRKNEDKIIAYGRLGNDNFAILMKKEDFKEEYFDLTTQEAFAGSTYSEVAFQIIAYAGVYQVVERDLLVSVMCGRARMALNTVKGSRTHKVAHYDNVLRDNILLEQELSKELEEAIAGEQLQMYLQPQAVADETVIGAEALIRWNHPTRGTLGPDVFIPIFERNGLITEVDKYMWEAACKQLRKWQDAGKKDLYISVNISPKDFYFVDVYQSFVDLLEKYKIQPKSLKLEITESALMMDFERHRELINKLRALGFVVEMDDFGSAYSSLNMLKDIEVDVLKLDMAFLRQSQNTERGQAILQMIVGLAKRLGIPVISEGVETVEQLRFLTDLGCDVFQGFYLGRPIDVKQFESRYL